MTRNVARRATAIRTMAPRRSDQGARLKNTHHKRTASPQATPPSIPTIPASGATTGTPKTKSHCSATAATPGHSRSCLRGVPSWVWAIVSMLVPHYANQPSDRLAPPAQPDRRGEKSGSERQPDPKAGPGQESRGIELREPLDVPVGSGLQVECFGHRARHAVLQHRHEVPGAERDPLGGGHAEQREHGP